MAGGQPSSHQFRWDKSGKSGAKVVTTDGELALATAKAKSHTKLRPDGAFPPWRGNRR
jgi:hypothetical protein